MKLDITEDLFGKIYSFIIDDNITDIKWNGTQLWINDLKKGRYVALENGVPMKLEQQWLNIFTTRLANSMNVNFNMSQPSMQAETDELRLHAVHSFVSGEGKTSLAIRKTPACSRLGQKDLIGEGYVDEFMYTILPAMIRNRMSGCVIGDVGAGKTELEKWLCAFIPDLDGVITVEDTLEMKLPRLYPKKDIYSLKLSDSYSAVDAIRDALRLLTKWLILSEARGREIVQVMEAASTGCCAMTSIHAENTWEIPDRMINMAGDEGREGFENDIYTFFDYAVKVKAQVTDHGIFRKVDQLTFFDRDNGQNTMCVFYRDGQLTGEQLPPNFLNRFRKEKKLMRMYKEFVLKEPLTPEEIEEKEEEKRRGVKVATDFSTESFIQLDEQHENENQQLLDINENDDRIVLSYEKNNNVQIFDIYDDEWNAKDHKPWTKELEKQEERTLRSELEKKKTIKFVEN